MNIKKWSKDQLIASLKKEGLVFTDFSLVHEGVYAIDDADWNYKDVPHLHYVHELVEANFALMSDEVINTINIQKVLGFKMPLAVVNYESGLNEQTYYTTFLFYALIVQTRYEKIEENKTRVITNYNIGSTWLLKWTYPIIKFLIKKNYENLMSTDIPMRTRRGSLRELGYLFTKDTKTYSFIKTTEILKDNVEPSLHNTDNAKHTINILDLIPNDGEITVGQDDHQGLRLVRQAKNLMIFGRMCMHEGASLDRSSCRDGKLKCPWHGRLHAPLATINLLSASEQHYETKYHAFSYDSSGMLAIRYRSHAVFDDNKRAVNLEVCS